MDLILDRSLFAYPLADVVEDDVGADVEGLAGGKTYVGQADAVGRMEQAVVGGQWWLALIYVGSHTGYTAFGQRIGDGVDVHDVASGGVD